nr:hypothetical protein [Tanacetum cinerariifolium]
MIDDTFKKSVGYKYYRAKKAETDNIVKERTAMELAKSLSIKDQSHQQREIMTQLTINRHIESDVEDTIQGKQAREFKAGKANSYRRRIKYRLQKYHEFENISATDSDATQDSSRSDTDEEKDVKTDDFDDFDMDLFEDKPCGDDDATGFGVFMYNKSTEPLKSTYMSPTKLEALTSINVFEEIDKAVHAKVLTEMKKLIPTYVLKVFANYVKQRLNNFVLEVMQNNQISLFTKPSTFINDLLDMDLMLKLLNRIHENKTHPTNQKLYDTLYDSILLDQEALNAQEAKASFYKQTHDLQEPHTNHEGDKRKKRRCTEKKYTASLTKHYAIRLEENYDSDDLQQYTITNFKADHVDAYDSDCDDQATTNAIFMASLSSVG